MKIIKWIYFQSGGFGGIIALGLIQSAVALFGIGFALIMQQIVDCAVGGQIYRFWRWTLVMGGLIVLQATLRCVNRWTEERTRASMENSLRRAVFDGILRQDDREIAVYHSGELMNRFTSDTLAVVDGMVSTLPATLAMGLRIIGTLVVMRTFSPWLAVVFLLGGLMMVILSITPRKKMKNLHKVVQEADGHVRSFIQECLESLLIIHSFGCEKKMIKKNDSKMVEHRQKRLHKANFSNGYTTILNLAMNGGYWLGFVWCGLGILYGKMTYGTLTAVMQLIGQIQTPFANIGGTFPKYAATLASAERLMEMTDMTKSRKRLGDNYMIKNLYKQISEICFDRVFFRYDVDRPILEGLSFNIQKGIFVGIVGSSGFGKSTMMKLLLSVYNPDKGEIFFRLTDGNRLSIEKLPPGMFAYVPQGNHLMSGCIWEVVGFADPTDKIDREKVIMACQVACAADFIEALPQGYDTVLGERGSGLSEGQIQRLAVARAIYSDCPILLLDEATSALDQETERQLVMSLKRLPNHTVFLVTHRQEVWSLCDTILKLEGGI